MSRTLPDKTIDEAYYLLCQELDHWRVIGPDSQGTYLACRTEEPMGYAKPAIVMPDAPPQRVVNFRLKDAKHANACLQWHGLKAVLEQLELPEETKPFSEGDAGPSSENDEQPTG